MELTTRVLFLPILIYAIRMGIVMLKMNEHMDDLATHGHHIKQSEE